MPWPLRRAAAPPPPPPPGLGLGLACIAVWLSIDATGAGETRSDTVQPPDCDRSNLDSDHVPAELLPSATALLCHPALPLDVVR